MIVKTLLLCAYRPCSRYRNIEEWKKGPYFFSHITEIIRLASLYKYGGVYLDTDVIVMRDLSGLRNCLGTELAGSRGEAKILNGACARKGPTSLVLRLNECAARVLRVWLTPVL
jgi:hypothetical protein